MIKQIWQSKEVRSGFFALMFLQIMYAAIYFYAAPYLLPSTSPMSVPLYAFITFLMQYRSYANAVLKAIEANKSQKN